MSGISKFTIGTNYYCIIFCIFYGFFSVFGVFLLCSAPVTAQTSAPPSALAPARGLSVRSDAPKSHQNMEWVTKFAGSAKEIRELKLDATRPKICLSYHLRGTCFESCRENATHRALTASEKTTVQVFLDKTL